MIDLDNLERLAKAAPSGQWEVWTSNSWRRVYSDQGREKVRVIEPCSHPMDSHPDLMFGPGVKEWLEGVTPDVIDELIAEVRRLREDAERLDYLDLRNDRKNVRNGTRYGWGLTENCNRIALEDNHFPVLTVREAIDASRTKEKPE